MVLVNQEMWSLLGKEGETLTYLLCHIPCSVLYKPSGWATGQTPHMGRSAGPSTVANPGMWLWVGSRLWARLWVGDVCPSSRFLGPLPPPGAYSKRPLHHNPSWAELLTRLSHATCLPFLTSSLPPDFPTPPPLFTHLPPPILHQPSLSSFSTKVATTDWDKPAVW